MHIRAFRPGDEPALLDVFRSSVHMLTATHYSAAQRAAWAPVQVDLQEWAHTMQRLQPLVVAGLGQVRGFADLQDDGMIHYFYVSGASARRGLGRLVMQALHVIAEERELRHLHAHVSHTARPFFEHFGFRVLSARTVHVAGIPLENWQMEKVLIPASVGRP